LNVFLFCAFAIAAGSAILAGVIPGDGAKAITSGVLAVVVLAVILGLNRSQSR
jgi:hypothetical protein